MAIYIIIIIQLVLCAIIYDIKGRTKRKDFWMWFTLLSFICLAGFRYRMGTDSIFYEQDFAAYPKLWELNFSFFTQNKYAPLYIIFNSLLRSITDLFFIVQFIHAAIINGAIFYAIKKCGYDKYIFTILLFYFCNMYYGLNCEVLRESIAVAIFLFSIDDILENRNKQYFIKIIIAVGFHYGAIILFVIPLLKNIKIDRKYIIISVILLLALPIIRRIPIINILLQVISNSFLMSYAGYVTGIDLSQMGFTINQLIIYYILPIGCSLYLRKRIPSLSKYDFLLSFHVFCIWMSILFIPIFIRFNNYLGLFYYSYLAISIVEFVKRSFNKSSVCFMIILLPFAITVRSSWINANVISQSDVKRIEMINPYTSIFDKNINLNREEVFSYKVI